MALHPTPALSFGSPSPSYAYVDGRALTAQQAAEHIRAGAHVHVPDQTAAADVLTVLGMSSEAIQARMDVAHGLA